MSPESLEIVGPETSVKRAHRGDDGDDFDRRLRPIRSGRTSPIGLIDPALRLKTQRTVTVSVKIAPGPLERSLRGRARPHPESGPAAFRAGRPAVVDVGLRGSRETLARLSSDDVTAYVDVGGLGAGEYMLAVHADASSRAGMTHIDPATVQVRITSAKN